jgi:transcriptional regulator
MAADAPLPLLPGTIDLLILRALRWEPTHGAGVAEWIRLVTGGAFALEDGTVYPALHRLEDSGFVESEWGRSDHNRRARFYNLTSEGRTRLRLLLGEWGRYRDAVDATIRHGYPHALWAEEPGRRAAPLAPDRSDLR